jgi:hypothetical protein
MEGNDDAQSHRRGVDSAGHRHHPGPSSPSVLQLHGEDAALAELRGARQAGGFDTVALDPDYDSGHQAREYHAPSKRASSAVLSLPCDGIELGTL